MYRKFTAKQIFNGYDLLPADYVLITDNKGRIEDIVPFDLAGEDIQVCDGMLSPGFINSHCHLELSHMKGLIPKNTGLVDFVLQIISNRNADPEIIQEAIAVAENEMLKNGIVAVGDICNTDHTISQKSNNNLYYHNFIETSGFPELVADFRFQQAKLLYDQFASILNHNSIVPHAPYSVSTTLLKKILAFKANEVISIHNQETIEEDLFYQNKEGAILQLYEKLKIDIESFIPTGLNSIRSFLPFYNSSQKLILVHNVTTSVDDISAVNSYHKDFESNLFFCLCPNANQYISGTLPDVNMLVNSKCNLVLGTDSLASNDQLSILSEIQMVRKSFPSIPFSEILKWATINGARALNISNQFGSFEKGKIPGVLNILEDEVKLLM